MKQASEDTHALTLVPVCSLGSGQLLQSLLPCGSLLARRLAAASAACMGPQAVLLLLLQLLMPFQGSLFGCLGMRSAQVELPAPQMYACMIASLGNLGSPMLALYFLCQA